MNSLIAERKERNNSIDLFRYVCAILVVVIHSAFWRNWGNFGYFIGEIMTRIAVPFFFAVSGFFYIKKLEDGTPVFIKQIKNYLYIYAGWSSIYFAVDFVQQIVLRENDLIGFLKEWIVAFFLIGSNYAFWFFPAIIFSVCFVTIFYKLKIKEALIPTSIVLYLVGCLGCSYHKWGVELPLLGNLFQNPAFQLIRRILLMGVPFFATGGIVQKLHTGLQKTAKLYRVFLVVLCLFLAEIAIVGYFGIADTIVITLGLYPLVICTMLMLLMHPMRNCGKIAEASRTIANITYYSHPLIMLLLRTNMPEHIVRIDILVFVATILLTFGMGLFFQFFIKRKYPRIFKFFLG